MTKITVALTIEDHKGRVLHQSDTVEPFGGNPLHYAEQIEETVAAHTKEFVAAVKASWGTK